MEVAELQERSNPLYTIKRLPPGMTLCTNQDGAMRLLNRSRVTIWRMVNDGRLRGFDYMGQVLIPLVDIAAIMRISPNDVYNALIDDKLPIVQYYIE